METHNFGGVAFEWSIKIEWFAFGPKGMKHFHSNEFFAVLRNVFFVHIVQQFYYLSKKFH